MALGRLDPVDLARFEGEGGPEVPEPAAPEPQEIIMSRTLESFANFSLEVVAVRTADNSDFQFEYPASGPQSTPSALTTPLEQPMERRRDHHAETNEWHHGGINE